MKIYPKDKDNDDDDENDLQMIKSSLLTTVKQGRVC